MAAVIQNVLIVEQLAHIQTQQAQDDQVILTSLKGDSSGRKEGRGDAGSDLA